MDLNILIVEDEPKLREVLCDYFRSRGDTPTEAEDGLQAVENFASNAIKYTTVGGSIRVRVVSHARGSTLTVENDSPPLTQEQLSKVWDTFYRVDESRTKGGTGLGLTIAKSIITLHGGKCSAWNTKTGVAFSFTL